MYRNSSFQYEEKFMKTLNFFKSNVETQLISILKHNSDKWGLFQDGINPNISRFRKKIKNKKTFNKYIPFPTSNHCCVKVLQIKMNS